MINNIILFKDFYELFLDNIDNLSVIVNTPEYNGIKYTMTNGRHRIVVEDTEEYRDMINRLNNNEILDIGINKRFLNYIIDNDTEYYNHDIIKYDSICIQNIFSLYHRWADKPSIDIKYEINNKLKRISINIDFTIDNRNDGLPDWCSIEISNTYWFNPSCEESFESNLFYLEFMEQFKKIVNKKEDE